MTSDLPAIDRASLSGMRRVLAKASSRLSIAEGSLQHEQLAMRILSLFESMHDDDEVLAAALRDDRFETLEAGDHVALAQLGAAAVLLWHELGVSVRDKLLRTATTVVPINRTADASDRLCRLISTHEG